MLRLIPSAFFVVVLLTAKIVTLKVDDKYLESTRDFVERLKSVTTFDVDFNCNNKDVVYFIDYQTKRITFEPNAKNISVLTQPYRYLTFCHPANHKVVLPHKIRKKDTINGCECTYFKNGNESFKIETKYKNVQGTIVVGIIPPKYKAVIISQTVYRNIQHNQRHSDEYSVGQFHYRGDNHLTWFKRYVYKLPFHSAYLLQTSHLKVADASVYANSKMADELNLERDVYVDTGDGKPFGGSHDAYKGSGLSIETSRRLVSLLSFGTPELPRSPYGVVVVLNQVSQYTDGIQRHGLHAYPNLGVACIGTTSATAKDGGNELAHELGHIWGLRDFEGANGEDPHQLLHFSCHPQKRRSLHVKYDGEIADSLLKKYYCKCSAMNGGDLDGSDDGLTAYSDYELSIIENNIRNKYVINPSVSFSGCSYVLFFNDGDTNLDVLRINAKLPQSQYLLRNDSMDCSIEGYDSRGATVATIFINVEKNRAFVLPALFKNFVSIRVITPKFDKIAVRRKDNDFLPSAFEFPNGST